MCCVKVRVLFDKMAHVLGDVAVGETEMREIIFPSPFEFLDISATRSQPSIIYNVKKI